MYKVFIQHHGANLRSKNTFDKSLVDGKIVSRVEGAERFIFVLENSSITKEQIDL